MMTSYNFNVLLITHLMTRLIYLTLITSQFSEQAFSLGHVAYRRPEHEAYI